MNFLDEKAHGKVLDVACATGNITKELKDRGHDILGIDLEEKLIDRAIHENNVNAIVKNMLDIDTLDDNFGLIYCIGNSLVHLHDKTQVKTFLEKSYDKLEPNGNLVIQIINFCPFLKNEGEFLGSLPTIKNDKIEFVRKYYRNGDYIRFNTVLNTEENSIENNIDLLPITVYDLKKFLEDIGFKSIEIYGGFNKSEFDVDNSTPLVISCSK